MSHTYMMTRLRLLSSTKRFLSHRVQHTESTEAHERKSREASQVCLYVKFASVLNRASTLPNRLPSNAMDAVAKVMLLVGACAMVACIDHAAY